MGPALPQPHPSLSQWQIKTRFGKSHHIMKATVQLANYEIMCRHESGRRTTQECVYKGVQM